MRVADALIDQGDAKVQEDMLYVEAVRGFYGVGDGVGAPYSPATGQKLYAGATGGQLVVATLARTLLFPQLGGEHLEEILFEANSALRQHEDWVNDAGRIPGASLALTEVQGNNIHIVTAGDAFAVWQMKDGKWGATPNPTFKYEQLLIQNFEKCLRESGQDVGKAWDAHLPFMQEYSRRYKNIEFAEFNGQLPFHRLCIRVELNPKELHILILFTDGLVSFAWTENPNMLAEKVLTPFQRNGGLRGVLNSSREYAHRRGEQKRPEATAIALEF